MNKIDVLILNREEGAKLTGIDYKEEKKIFAALDKVINGIVVMTEGPKGAIVSDGKRIYRAGTYKEKKVVDRTGAGDAFGSGFVSGLIQTGDIEYAISLGSANGTSVVEHIGAQPGILTKTQFRQRFKKLKMEKIPIK
ncbi:MAG: PfkB family kinase, nonfunctional [Candidatus Azambacteria bacterium GW2011_GWF2_46_32]|uniref:PfkB family kinase, nonfunctional n=1 Tax=Candidatus Azambacteria bacterium GW2011_GWF2_46_32 TaxID=1618628 RepID=A0A0G1PZ61_9BACT|nr:MAG: PfkB family kinase, nonfunctional [Candidatus Azambacteria bacterium GW2011_GWF2_46_32]